MSQSAFAPCVHLAPQRAFAPPRTCSRARPRMTAAPEKRRKDGSGPSPTSPTDPPRAPDQITKRWDGVRRVVRASAVSLSVLLCSMSGVVAGSGPPGGQVRVPRDAAGDVEAAAVTLGAVTVGGLVMRAVLASRRDEDKEREKLAAECARLEQEELLRARRLKRKALERVDGSADLPEDDDLRSSLMKRLQDIGSDSSDDTDGGDLDEGKNKFMRNTPIPDRGTGSMLLDRPDDAGASDNLGGTADGEEEEEDGNVNPEELEMLNRMWNLNSPDNEDRTS